MRLFGLFFIAYLMLTSCSNGSQCRNTQPTECDCQSSANMDIVFAIDTTCFNSQLSTIKTFLIDIINRNYFTSNTQFGFVLFNNEYLNFTSIHSWTDTAIQTYIKQEINHELDVFHNRHIDEALNRSIHLFQHARSYTTTNRILVLITHHDPSNAQSVCQYTETLATEQIDLHIIKIYDLTQSPYQCLLNDASPNSAPHWLTLDYWTDSEFYQIYPHLKHLFCIHESLYDSYTTTAIAVQEDDTVEYLLTLRDNNIWTQYSTLNAIRNRLTLAIQNYFSVDVAFTYTITIQDIQYAIDKQDTTIVFVITKPGHIGWSTAEISDIYASYEDGQFYYLLAYYLNIQWIVNGVTKTSDQVLIEFNNGNVIAVKRDLLNLLLTDFPRANTPTTTMDIDDDEMTTSSVLVIEAPRVWMSQYDIKSSVLSVEFDSGIDYDAVDVCDCMNILTADSVYLLGTQAFCTWISHEMVSYSIGNDNTLLSKAVDRNASYIEFKPNLLASYYDTNAVQSDSMYLHQAIQFMNDDDLQIKAIIDGITATTICNDLYYSSARSLGHYGTALDYTWEVVYNKSVIVYTDHGESLTLSIMDDILHAIDVSSVEWPMLIEIRLNLSNWLGMTDTSSYYTWIKHDYSLGIIHVIGDQFQRTIAYNLKHKLRAVSYVSICNVSNGTITENKIYSTLLSQYELDYQWRMIDSAQEVQTMLLDPNHDTPDTFSTVHGDVLSSSTTILFSDAYSLIPFAHYLFEISVRLFNSTHRDYVSAQVLPPNMYVKPSIFKIISADSGVDISVNDLFSIKDPYSTILNDPYNLSLSNMLSNPNHGYVVQWQCFTKHLTHSESSNIIHEFQTATTGTSYTDLYNISTFYSCDDHLTFDAFDTSLSFGVGELLISNKYIFEMTVYDPYYSVTLVNYYMFWINPGLLPMVTIHTSQSKQQRRKYCNADGNRIVFVAEIDNLWQLKQYYNFNDDPTDNIRAYVKKNHRYASSGSEDSDDSDEDSEEEYQDMMTTEYKHVTCNWYSNQVDLKCKQIRIANNVLMIKQQNKGKKKKKHKQCILDGGFYTFNVECALDNGLIGSSSITIGTNTPPFGGYCYFKEYGHAQYAFDDTIVIELDAMEYQTELTVICMNWNDEHTPLTQNIRTVYPALVDSCVSYGISSASSVDWNQCKGSYFGEFEQGDNQLILGLGEHVLIAVIRDALEYDTVYKLPGVKVTDSVFDLTFDIDTPSPTAATIVSTTTKHPTTVSSTTPSPVDQSANFLCDDTIIQKMSHSINLMVDDLDDITQDLSQIGDTQIYFQVLQSMSNALDHYMTIYGQCFSSDMQQLILDAKIKIIELTRVIMDTTSTTKTVDNIGNQLNVISNVLDLYCAGSDAYNDSCVSLSKDTDGDYSSCITSSDIVSQSSKTLTLLSQYFTENASVILFGIVEDLVADILALDDFQDDTLDASMSDTLIDIISSIHIWFVLNLGSNINNSKYDDLQNITHLIQLIASQSMSNTSSIIDESTYWNTCWMDIDLSLVQLDNMSACNGYASNVVWPANMTNYVDDIYDVFSTVQCLVSEIIYNDELVLNIELTDPNDNVIIPKLRNDTMDTCDAIEFTLCGTDTIYTLLDEHDDNPLLSLYDLPICQWSLMADINGTNGWNTTGCYVDSYTSSCVTCKCTHLTLFKANADEFEPKINIITKSSFQNITAEHIGEHPEPLIFVLLSTVFCIASLIVAIKYCKPKDETPLIAVPEIMNKSVKTKMMNESGHALSLIEIHRTDVSLASKICNVFMFYMRDYHPLLSIFAATKHTNYSTAQRIFCCFMYIMTVSAVSALFYGQHKETVVGSLVLMIWGSLWTCIPVYFVIYLFQFSRPIERDSQIKDAIMKAKLLKAPCHQLVSSEVKQLSLELCAKWLISEMVMTGKDTQCVKDEAEEPHQMPVIYPDQSSETSGDSFIPPLPDSTHPMAERSPPPKPPKRLAAPPPPKRPARKEISMEASEEEDDERRAGLLMVEDGEQMPLSRRTGHSIMNEIEGEEEESETPPWCRAPPSWNGPSKAPMNAPRPMMYGHHKRKQSYDALQKHIGHNNDSEYSADDEKMEYIPDTMSQKKRILVNAVRIVHSEMVRKRLLRAEYPLPHSMKHIAWGLMVVQCVLCMVLIVIYGAHFDLVYNACVAWREDNSDHYHYYNCDNTSKRRRLEENECYWKDTLNDRINEDIMEYIDDIIHSDEFSLNGIPDEDEDALKDGGIINGDGDTNGILIGDAVDNRADIYGANVTDSSKWIISCFVTLLIGLIIWQPIWLCVIAILSVKSPSFGTLKCSKMLCGRCFAFFRKFDEETDNEQMLLAQKLNINSMESMGQHVYKTKPKHSLASNTVTVNTNHLNERAMMEYEMGGSSIESKSSERRRKRLQREQELSDHYHEDAKIARNAQPTILSHAMVSLQQRQSQTFNESIVSRCSSKNTEQKRRSAIYDEDDIKLDEKEEEYEDIITEEEDRSLSKSSDLFGVGEDDVVYFDHANNRHHRAACAVFDFNDFILNEDEYDLSIDTDQFLRDIETIY